MRNAVLLSLAALLSWYPSSGVSAQSATWQTLLTAHFEFFSEPQSTVNVDRAVFEAERAYGRISLDLRHQLAERISVVLLGTADELTSRQDAIRDLIGNDPTRHRNLLFVSMESDELLEGTLMHELTHQFQFEFLSASPRAPGWVLEGLAEFERGRWMPSTVSPVRTSVTVPIVSQLTSADREGGRAVFSFIADEFGTQGIRRLLLALRESTTSGDVFDRAFGLSEDEFESQFASYMRAY
jgi:hypothetical protein